MTRAVVHPGSVPVPAFEITDKGESITRELVAPDGEPCDSGGKPLSAYPVKPAATKRRARRKKAT